jgi:hypothetical protein
VCVCVCVFCENAVRDVFQSCSKGGVNGEQQWLRLRSLPRGVRVFVQRCAALIARCFDAACVHVERDCVCVRLFVFCT